MVADDTINYLCEFFMLYSTRSDFNT